MQATATEIAHALAIRKAAAVDSKIHLGDISDFELVQHAIIAKSNVGKALLRVKRLQAVNERYGILAGGSYDEGLRDLSSMIRSFPGLFLGIGRGNGGEQVLSYDFPKYKAHCPATEEGYSMAMRAFFYSLQAAQPDFASIRAGVVILGDFESMRWDNLNFECEKRATQLYSNCYPMRLVALAFMGTNRITRFCLNLLRMFLPKKVKEAIMLPLSRDEHLKAMNLSSAALPEAWGGDQTCDDIMENIGANLQARYDNASKYKFCYNKCYNNAADQFDSTTSSESLSSF